MFMNIYYNRIKKPRTSIFTNKFSLRSSKGWKNSKISKFYQIVDNWPRKNYKKNNSNTNK